MCYKMSYKWCAVPKCTNTSVKTPNKLFLSVPKNVQVRRKWLQLSRRDNDIANSTSIFFCEDHFDMENDMVNYYQYKMGFSKKIILKDNVLPSKFHCQPDRIKRMCDAGTSRSAFVKRQRMEIIKQCEAEYIQQPVTVNDEPTAIVVEACTKGNMSGDWSENTILLFLEAYQMEECIWNPDHPNYKDRKKVHEAWVRLSQIMDSSVKDLKHKKEILMTTFRRHLKKKKESILSGEAPEKMYKPLWFAYDQMESFLAQVYTDKYTVKTEKVQKQSHKAEDTDEEDIKVHTKYVMSRRRRRPSSDQEETLTSYRRSSNHYSREEPPPREEDDVDLYSRLLAKKLREFSPDERKLLMYEIDTIIINKFKNRLQRRRTPSPRFLDMNSS